ncbi:MAG: helix-turn-helix transcriptional regulator [Planctomycetaceae bacterium]
MTTETEVVKRGGRRFVLVPESEYRRLKRLDETELPALPEADAHGNRPAVEYATASLARKIIGRRRTLGLTQVELARRAGVRAETISRLEAAKHVPSIATVDKIDRALRAAEARQAKNGRKRTQ